MGVHFLPSHTDTGLTVDLCWHIELLIRYLLRVAVYGVNMDIHVNVSA